MLTLTDLFCGAGGSSTGATQVDGIEVHTAANHWQLAVDTHNANHPDARHVCADLSQIDPRLFHRTDIAWMSPSCTKHSIAQGKKRQDAQPDLFGDILPDEAAERSRATMWDVVRFAEHHHYESVMVENVVDVVYWPPFKSWLLAMDSIGYDHKIIYLNSMHAQRAGAGAAQSRDRVYIVFWRKGNPRPDFDSLTRPHAVCPDCGPVRAMQVWKKHDREPWGRYRAQYVYRCPNVSCRNQVVEPTVRPASDIIDWSLEGQRIGDRARPLAEKTMNRIQAGIDRYWSPVLVPVEGRDGKTAMPTDAPLRTMTTRNETGLAVPFIAEMRGGGSTARSTTDPLATVTASGNHHGLVTPPEALTMTYYGNGGVRPVSSELSTVTTVEKHAVIAPGARPTIDVDDVRFRMLEPSEIIRAMDFPGDYEVMGNRREKVRMAGNAVTPCAARDIVAAVAESLHGAARIAA